MNLRSYRDPQETLVPVTPAEKALGDLFLQARGEAGACMFELDLTEALAFRDRMQKDGFPGLTFTHILIRACAQVLAVRPELGYRMAGYRLVRPSAVDVGVSVAGARGGLAPVVVLRGVEEKGLGVIMEELTREARRAREEEEAELRTLSRLVRWIPLNGLRRWLIRLYFKRYQTIREFVGTFHITNVGPLGIDFAFSPVVMATLMTVGQIRMRPVVRDGEVVAAPSAIATIQGDHRIVDGKRAADFVKELIGLLKAPEALLQ